jgi:membrane-bound lytic murein transglycosylase MltF
LKVYRINEADAVIALHNNTQGMYSALSYARGGAHAHDAEDVFIRDGTDPDDFFFVTERVVFDSLKRRGHNVVLQDNRRVTDDGSLSVYCGKENVRYINVEADHGHLKEQTQMILDLKAILDEFGPLKRAVVTSVTTDH